HTLQDLKNFLVTSKATASLKYNSSTTDCVLSTGIDTFDIRDSKKKKIVTATNIYFYDKEFVELLCPFTGVILIDATFDAVPHVKDNSNMQFLSILAKITFNGHSKAFPVFWVIMSNKAEECYLKAFNYFASQFPTFQPTTCLTDHELAMRNAVKKIYPDIINRTCYFHYSQALIKNAKEKKVITSNSSTYSNPELFYVINLLKYLAFLPAHCINVTYEAVKEEAKNYFEDLFNDFFEYYEDQWLKKEGPKQFSVFDRLEDRTTNIVESYHSQLNALTVKHPDSNKFL
ncbi:Protein of unknown function, partial [Cotesia congregata]